MNGGKSFTGVDTNEEYDEEKDVWLAGGLYQAQGIANGSVTFEMLCEELKEVLRPLMGGREDG